MKPQDALNLLDQVTSAISTDRRSHGQIQMALSSLQRLVQAQQPADAPTPLDGDETPEAGDTAADNGSVGKPDKPAKQTASRKR